MGARPLLRNARHGTMITPVNPPRLGLIHISPSCQTVYRSFEIILQWVLSIGLKFKSNVLCKPIASKKHSIQKKQHSNRKYVLLLRPETHLYGQVRTVWNQCFVIDCSLSHPAGHKPFTCSHSVLRNT